MASLRVLLIEDNEDDATLLLRELRHADYEILVAERTATADGLRAALARQAWDLITCDYNLPGFSALAALTLIREHDNNIPVVVVSGEIGEELTVGLIRAGAHDLVLKRNLGRLPGAVEHALRDAENRRRRAAAEAAAQEEATIAAALARVGQECVASLETSTLLQRVCRATVEVLGCHYSHTFLWDPEERAFVVAAGDDTPEHWERVRMLKFPLALIAEHAAQLRRDGIVHAGPAGLAGDSTAAAMAAATGGTASLLVPLWRGEELIGIHTAGYRRPAEDFAPWQRRVAAGIGHFASLALDNAHLLDRLTRSDRIKSEFLSTVSHELRTPLNHIIGFNDMLLEEAEQFTAEQADMLQTIGRSSRDLLALVNGILDVQRLEAAPAPAPTDIAELLRQLTTTTARLTDRKDLRVMCELPSELPTVRTDPPKLKAVLQNLIDNAVKFTPHGSITISAEPQDGGVLFTVADTGVGIPHDILPVIFEPFRQGDGSLTRQHGGVGLGLYTVRREVEHLGGEVTVESEVGRGSTFRVWIPCEQCPTTKVAADPQKVAPALYAEILDATNDLVQTATPDGRLLYANRAWQAALGYESGELGALSLDDIVHPKSRAKFYQARQRALGGDPVQGLHVKFITKDGRTLELEGSIRCRVANGEPAFTLGIYQNVTERTEAQRQAEARRRLLEAVLENLPVGVWITDATGRITQANPAALRIWGGARYVGVEEYSRYKGWFLPSGRAVAAEEWAAARAIATGETTIDEEVEIESFDGTRKIILNSAVPLSDEGQDIVGAIIIDHDITGRKQVEQALRESEQRFRALVEHAADGIYVHDTAGIIVEVNAQACDSVGYARDELIGRPLTDIDSQLDPERARQDLLQLESGAPVLVETMHRRKDGSTFPVEVRSVRITWNGRPHVFGICRDVTERHRLAESLQLRATHAALEAEIGLRLTTSRPLPETLQVCAEAIVKHLGAAFARVWTLNHATQTLELQASAGLYTHLDGPHGRVPVGKFKIGLIAQEQKPHLTNQVIGDPRVSDQDWAEREGMVAFAGYPLIIEGRAEGVLALFSRHALPDSTLDVLGRVVHAVALGVARQRAEEGLREARASLDLAVAASRIGFWDWDLQTGETRYAESWHTLFGYSRADFDGSPEAWATLVHPEDLDRVARNALAAVENAASPYEEEFRLRHKNGAYRWVLSRAAVLRNAAGDPQRMVGAHLDVTERKQAEDAARHSARQVQALFEASADVIGILEADGTFRDVSASIRQLLGYEVSEVVGRNGFDFVHPDDRAALQAAFASRVAQTGNRTTEEYRLQRADGSWIYVESTLSNLLDDPDVHALMTTTRDITERVRAEQKMNETTAFLTAIIENIPDMIFVKDAESLRFVRINRAGEELLGYGREDLVGQSDYDFFTKSEADFFTKRDREVLDRRQLVDIPEEPIHTREKGERILHTKKIPILDPTGQARFLLGISRDITERKAISVALDARTKALEAANKELEAFSYSVSHDLRAPLRAIEGFSRILLEDHARQLDAEGARSLERVRAATLRMGQLIDDLLKLSRVQRGQLRRALVDLSALARVIVADLRETTPGRAVDVAIADSITANGDVNLLRVALENLLGNAWKYTGKHATARIEFGVTEQNGQPVYFVRDDGAGFDMGYADKLFGAFQRLHAAQEFEGTGIGLAIVQRIIRRHGGSVWTQAAVEQGATFYFTLPPAGGVDERPSAGG